MPSSTFPSFTVHKFPLVSCSAFLKTVNSFHIFLTPDYFAYLSLLSTCPLSPSIFIAGEYKALWVPDHLSYSTWHLPSLTFLSVAPIQFLHVFLAIVEPSPLCWGMPFCLSISLGLLCGAATQHSYPDNLATCLSCDEAKAQLTASVQSRGPSRRKYICFHIYYYSY